MPLFPINTTGIVARRSLTSCISTFNGDKELPVDPEEVVRTVLEAMSFQVEKLPEGRKRTPDFLVSDGKEKYLIELKTRQALPQNVRDQLAHAAPGDLIEHSEPAERNNRVTHVIQEAHRQLRSFDGTDQVYRLVWLLAKGPYDDLWQQQCESTLYGRAELVVLRPERGLDHKTCYYFDNSEFHRFADSLDGAIVSSLGEGKLCLNTLSSRYESLRKSRLAETFGEGLCDPLSRIADGSAWIVEGAVNRRDETAVLRYLSERYGERGVQRIRMGYISAMHLVGNPSIPRSQPGP